MEVSMMETIKGMECIVDWDSSMNGKGGDQQEEILR